VYLRAWSTIFSTFARFFDSFGIVLRFGSLENSE